MTEKPASDKTQMATYAKCCYCGEVRPVNEMKHARIRMNRGWHLMWVCDNGKCAGYLQMSMEG